MNLDWEIIWELLLFGYGVYFIICRPSLGVGIDGHKPVFFINGKLVIILGIFCILLSYKLFLIDWWKQLLN